MITNNYVCATFAHEQIVAQRLSLYLDVLLLKEHPQLLADVRAPLVVLAVLALADHGVQTRKLVPSEVLGPNVKIFLDRIQIFLRQEIYV